MEKNAYSVSCQLVSTHAKLNVLTKWLKKKNIMMSEIVEQEITNLQVLLINVGDTPRSTNASILPPSFFQFYVSH